MSRPLHAVISGLGSAIPEKVMTNADLERMIDTSDEWITQRTGIKERRIAGDGESTATLASAAARQALDSAGTAPDELDLIVCATITPEMIFPSTACFIQDALGAKDVPSFDISAACSGFLYGLTVADQFIRTGTYRKILVVGADTLSKFTDYTDRTSCILFGDAAGAAVLESSEEKGRGILYSVLHADGSGWDYIHVPAGGSRTVTSSQTVEQRQHYIKMRGRDVYKFAVAKMQWLLGDCLEKCGLSVADVDLVIPHQVNSRILVSAAERYDFPMDKVYLNIDRFGNTSASSIPLAMDEARREGKIGPGSLVLLVAFGAGLTWAGTVLRL